MRVSYPVLCLNDENGSPSPLGVICSLYSFTDALIHPSWQLFLVCTILWAAARVGLTTPPKEQGLFFWNLESE